ncbi:P-loop containing nucleoside triphosphate hydrolase protein [Stachybotrys elegans]|uniref:P-loop containing nucleoside triphosphate hydrolase protein n=1 Tax=Stachybotrys elegans TaxID=80388 RepID=A0A8K0SIV5_9HYPO|nr:P-loop containing nucleoside triphosphate hydrolase protein [Stachybotrys elegans]
MSTPKSYASTHAPSTSSETILMLGFAGMRAASSSPISIQRIKRISSIVESEADMARMRQNGMMDKLSTKSSDDEQRSRYRHLPLLQNAKFTGRDDVLSRIQAFLHPKLPSKSTQSVALFGMGGVGKTQVALQYAYQYADTYDIIIWIAAETPITIGQSFREVAQGLHLCHEAEELRDTAVAIQRVKNWLSTTSSRWLIMFDNADDLASVKLEPFNESEGSQMLLRQVGLHPEEAAHQEHATSITQAFGGLPLALSQIGGFIAQRRIPLKGFLQLYEKNAAKIDARKTVKDDYEHTLSTVWDVSFAKLPEESTSLLNLMVFFDPDSIDEEILLQGSQSDPEVDSDFEFLTDDMDLGDAEQPLLQVALINKGSMQPIISVHRLIQSSAFRRLPAEDQSKYFDTAVRLLSWGFPDTWSKDVGHQINAWKRCEKCLPHIDHLARFATKHPIQCKNPQLYAELLLRCSWYLYEREMYEVARSLAEAAVGAFDDKTTLAYASAIDLVGLIDLDLCKPALALQPFKQALDIRKARLGPSDAFIAFSLNNLALAYTELGDLEEAHRQHQEAIAIRLGTNSDRIGNSYSNMASLLLKMDKADEAEEMLARCPSLKDFTDETFLNTGNPRFSGDMVLLSRIRLRQGRIDDALRLASKALTFRQTLLGNRLKTCDSLFDVASILQLQNHQASAIDLLKQLVNIAESLKEGEGQLARALHKLSGLCTEKGMTQDAEDAREKALKIRNRLRPDLAQEPFDAASFGKLTLWMLW